MELLNNRFEGRLRRMGNVKSANNDTFQIDS